MGYELEGILTEIFDTQEVTSTYSKREFVIEKTESAGGREFTETIKFQLSQDRCSIIDSYRVGDEINVLFNIKGRRVAKNDKVFYFTNLEAWKLEKNADQVNETPIQEPPKMDEIPPEVEEDDLPF